LFVDDLMHFGKPIEAHSELIESRSIADQPTFFSPLPLTLKRIDVTR
jgi:hypothetical protein